MHAVRSDISALAVASSEFKRVLFTTVDGDVQYTAVRLLAGMELGNETHADHHQITVVALGHGEATVAGARIPIAVGSVVAVPRDTSHNVRNLDDRADMHLVVVYRPPKYARDAVFLTREDHARDEKTKSYRG